VEGFKLIVISILALMALCTIIAIPLGIIKARADIKEKKINEERYQEEVKYRQEMLKISNKG